MEERIIDPWQASANVSNWCLTQSESKDNEGYIDFSDFNN